MRRPIYLIRTFFILLFALSFTNIHAQLFEDFEDGSKTSYSGSSVTLSSGDWYLDDALIGSLSNDKYNGSQGVRMDRRNNRQGNIYMLFDKSGGADELSFYMANYGSSSGNTLQVQYSTDQGTSWTDLGDELTATTDLEKYTIAVAVEGDIRFKFIHAAGDDRLNIDDIRITDYVTPEEDPTIDVFVDDAQVESGSTISFPSTLAGTERQKNIEIRNRGEQTLTINDFQVEGAAYQLTTLSQTSLEFNESATATLTFAPESEGNFQGLLQIASNAVNVADFSLNIAGDGFEDGEVLAIANAKSLPFGTRVTVGGRVTVANEFDGPIFMEDETGGIAVFYDEIHTAVEIGDSVVVTGPLTEFNPIGGAEGDFLTQISTTSEDDNVTFEVIDVEKRIVEPTVVTVSQMNSGEFEGQLITILNATIGHTGAFQANTNYTLTDQTDEAFIRIDNSTNLVGATAPEGQVNVIGVVDQFNGDYQLKPRFTNDLDVEETTIPGEDVSKDLTFEVVTWNIEWFGSTSNGPDNVDLQFENVKTVITEIDADLYAFQEIANPTRFAQLIDELEEYGGVLADFSQSQKTAYLFKRATVDSLDSGLMSTGFTQSYWANGRYPLHFLFNAKVQGDTRLIYAYNIHAKAFSDESSYNQRWQASRELKFYLDNNRSTSNVLFLGDYNDTIEGSITTGEESPYKNFFDDPEYTVITQSLEERGFASQTSGSMIDHITISSELSDEYFPGTERVENPTYVGSYLSSTSDHFPIWTRFAFDSELLSSDPLSEIPNTISLSQNYPNPFNPTTVINFTLNEGTSVTLKVFDMLGREVATLINAESRTSGAHQVNFDATDLSSGMYLYRLSTSNGHQLTKKMLLVK